MLRCGRWMLMITLLVMISSSTWGNTVKPTTTFETLTSEAQRLQAEGSHRQALALYEQAGDLELTPDQRRWLSVHRADAGWRNELSSRQGDRTRLETYRETLMTIEQQADDSQDDLLWVAAQTSLGDSHWIHPDERDWYQAWRYYQAALDFWAGARDIDLARERYLTLIERMAGRTGLEEDPRFGRYGTTIPLEILTNGLEIARDPDRQAWLHYLIAMTLQSQGAWHQRAKLPDEFEAALKGDPRAPWYDDALFAFAMYLSHQGRVTMTESGQWRQEPDYERAKALFHQLRDDYGKGRTAYFEKAGDELKIITKPNLELYVSSFFLPGSEVEYQLRWRNLEQIALTLYPMALTEAVQLNKGDGLGKWLQRIPLAKRPIAAQWTKTPDQNKPHHPETETLRLESPLEPGAYILEARSGKLHQREVVLVSDTALVMTSAANKTVVYVTNVHDGAPLAGAEVVLWEGHHKGYAAHRWTRRSMISDADGLAVFQADRDENRVDQLAFARLEGHQAYAIGSHSLPSPNKSWRVYAITDRPAYRPEDTVHWKIIARQRDGLGYAPPSKATLQYEIKDPRGTQVAEGKVTLNAMGSAWAELELNPDLPLGLYQIHFKTDTKSTIGSAELFQLEEYKLPEFKVQVATPEVHGKKKIFRTGDTLEVEVQAEYYFGGPVANADVEVLVRQRSFYVSWAPPQSFPWLVTDRRPNYYAGEGAVIRQETLKTDATGRATLRIDTSQYGTQNLEYRIEARVTDASRREVVGTGSIRVSRQSFFAQLHRPHLLHRPNAPVQIQLKTLDANGDPFQAKGVATVTRTQWQEIWRDPQGREITGQALEAQRRRGSFPPPQAEDGRPWHLKSRGYIREEILQEEVQTDLEGDGILRFAPAEEGYYEVAWRGVDLGRAAVVAQTTLWVATPSSQDIGYHGGLEILLDKRLVRAGETTPVAIITPDAGRFVLFTQEGDGLISHQLLRMDGTLKLLELPIRAEFAPNIQLAATTVYDLQLHTVREELVIPPTEHFLQVEVTPESPFYQPGDEATLAITTRDQDGNPVDGEVALGLVDASIYAIREDGADDPRAFFYAQKRGSLVQTTASFNQHSYQALLKPQDTSTADVDLEDEDSRAMELMDYAESEAMDGFGAARPVMSTRMRAASSSISRRAPARKSSANRQGAGLSPDGMQSGDGEDGAAVQVRSDFRATAFWQPDVLTRDGKASVTVTLPDSLTEWRASARAVGPGNTFGQGRATTRTRQPLMIRLQAPRFFVVGDAVVISALINNNTEVPLNVSSSLEAHGLHLLGKKGRSTKDGTTKKRVMVPARGEVRVDWRIRAETAGDAVLKVTARAGSHGDAMEKRFPVLAHGIERFISHAGKLREKQVKVALELPKERQEGSDALEIQISPSLAVTMLDALPYLIDYPYGCTEQTMSRFLPAVVTARTLQEMGLEPRDIARRSFGGIDPEHAGDLEGGKAGLKALDGVVKRSLNRLYDFQHSDGGWGWWKAGESDPFMSAYVLWGLNLAREAGVTVKAGPTKQAAKYLRSVLVEAEGTPDLQAWMLQALAHHRHGQKKKRGLSALETRAFDQVWGQRESLNAYSRALLALTAHYYGDQARAAILIRNLENGVILQTQAESSVIDGGGHPAEAYSLGTAHWGEDGLFWRWSEGGVETTAFVLRALSIIQPNHPLIEPSMGWLVNNRRGARWSNTRDTAMVILALTDYLRTSKELSTELSYEVKVNGKRIATQTVSPRTVLSAPSSFQVDPKLLRTGTNRIQIKRTSGEGPLYFSVRASFFSLEEPIPATGNQIFVRRAYFKYVGRPTLLKGHVYDKRPLKDQDSIQSGERVEVVMTIEAKNHYEYLVFEDLKPAGLEAIQLRSGQELYARELTPEGIEARFGPPEADGGAGKTPDPVGSGSLEGRARIGSILPPGPVPRPGPDGTHYTGRQRWVHQELRDRKVALFIDKLPEGVWELRYELRAEVPGEFHGMPTLGHAMYVPEIRCNGHEHRLKVLDRP